MVTKQHPAKAFPMQTIEGFLKGTGCFFNSSIHFCLETVSYLMMVVVLLVITMVGRGAWMLLLDVFVFEYFYLSEKSLYTGGFSSIKRTFLVDVFLDVL